MAGSLGSRADGEGTGGPLEADTPRAGAPPGEVLSTNSPGALVDSKRWSRRGACSTRRRRGRARLEALHEAPLQRWSRARV